jgi:hypothetical protein
MVVERGIEIGHGALLLGLEFVAQLLVLPVEQLVSAQQVDGSALGSSHEPGAGIVGDADLRPALERDQERVLCEVLGDADITHHAGEAGDQLRRFDAPDGIDGAMGLGGGHGYQSGHAPPPVQGCGGAMRGVESVRAPAGHGARARPTA